MSVSRQELFRPEVMQARRDLWIGRNTLALGLPEVFTSVATSVMMGALAALLVFGTYARQLDLHGIVLPQNGLMRVTSTTAGRIEAIAVTEGEQVKADQLLYVVNIDTATARGGTQQQILHQLAAQREMLIDQIERRQQMKVERDAEAERKIANFTAQIAQMGVQVSLKQQFVRADSKNYADFTKFKEEGLGTLSTALVHQQTWMHAVEDLEDMKSRSLRLEAELIDIQFQQRLGDLQTDDDVDKLRSQVAGIDQEVANAEAHRSLEFHAPGAGTITAIQVHAGQTVDNGQPLLTIVPAHATLVAQFLAPSTAIGFLRVGQRVLLRYSAFPFQKFGQHAGMITDVSLAALPQEELRQLVPELPAADRGKTFYRVTVMPQRQDVTVYGHAAPLQPSMQVDARVMLERRRLYEWLLEPLYALRGVRSS